MLPRDLAEWVASGTGSLVRRQGAGMLTVDRADETMILRERQMEVELTAREREVLAWVARGKTNPEIARLLWVSPSTVRKHLENVCGQLGVGTRTAAVTRFLGLLDAEASSMARAFSVASWNVEHFKSQGVRSRVEDVVEFLAEQRADVFAPLRGRGLQEVFDPRPDPLALEVLDVQEATETPWPSMTPRRRAGRGSG